MLSRRDWTLWKPRTPSVHRPKTSSPPELGCVAIPLPDAPTPLETVLLSVHEHRADDDRAGHVSLYVAHFISTTYRIIPIR